MTWIFPLPSPLDRNPVPVLGHPHAFGTKRKHHHHEGVDLVCPPGTPVYAAENGVVRQACHFTGPALGHPWWLDTWAIMIEGPSGLIVYGEMTPIYHLREGIGSRVRAGELIGTVQPVLPIDPARPERATCMLHLELRRPGHTELFDWTLDKPRPDWLLDPTPYLLEAT